MTAVSPTNSGSSVIDLLATSKGDIMAKAMAVLMTRYQGLTGDLEAQIGDIESRNAAKQLWNEQLVKLNKMMEDVAAYGKESNKQVDIYVSPDDLPYKDYMVTKGPDGTPQLVPTSHDDSNQLCTGDDCKPIYGPAGADPKTVATTPSVAACQFAAATVRTAEFSPAAASKWSIGVAPWATITRPLPPGLAPRPEAAGTLVGYKVHVSADQLKAATDNVRAKLDSLNTDNEIGMLRLNDTFSKSNLALEQMGKLLQGQNETSTKLLANF